MVLRKEWEGDVLCDLDEKVVVHRGLGCGVVSLSLFRLMREGDWLLVSYGVPLDCFCFKTYLYR